MVAISVKGNKETHEYQDALVLKQFFEASLGNTEVKGQILIISNATLFGQITKDVDIVVIGTLEKFSCTVNTKHKTKEAESTEYKETDFERRHVYVNNFCFVIETKRHRAEDIRLEGVTLLVKYNDRYSDVTTQSENQKYSLKTFFSDRLDFTPFICNFIWFRNISADSIKAILGSREELRTKHNYLPDRFTLPWLIQLACIQVMPYTPNDKQTGKQKRYSSFNCLRKDDFFDFGKTQEVFDLFTRIKDGAGELTRKKIEQITSKLLDQQQYAQAIGEKLVVISGRAGTGKTIKLLRIACDLSINEGARCLILTYNHALVSDIKRTLALAEIQESIDSYSVSITTLHKFVYELIIGFGIVKNPYSKHSPAKFVPDYVEKYNEYIALLQEYIDSGLIEEEAISNLMSSRHDAVGWDYVLIDESQDWNENEKLILFKIFGKNKLIIADGVDQLIRGQQKCNWTRGLKKDLDFRQTHEKKGLRQQVNLVTFVNMFAKEIGVTWELEPKHELIGGKIIVSTGPYSKELHAKEFERCVHFGNSAYEMMFLVPPRMVEKRIGEDQYGKKKTFRNFKHLDDFKGMGIDVWDGTNADLRSQYPVELSQHRLFQYESCRGLEGWTVVCLELDEFIKSKMEHFEEEETNELALESFDEKRNKFVYLWALIPLTRAIDTLVITVRDKNSRIAQSLRRVYEQCPDIIQWIGE